MDIEIREIEIRDLRPNSGEVEGLPRNPRKISTKNLEKLKKSVQDAPEMLRLRELIVVPHGGVFVVIAGNQRLEAAKAVGMTALPCKVLPEDTDPAKLREYAIKDNLPFGEDDWEVIASDWYTAELEEWGMLVPEKWKDNPTAEDDDFDADSVKESVCKKGDIWQLGNHRLMCGDSTIAEDVDRLMDGVKAELLLTDPPYGIKADKGFSGAGGFPGKGKPIERRHYKDKWDSERPGKDVFDFICLMAKNAIIFGGNFFADELPVGNHWLVWNKHNTMPTFSDAELAWTNIKRNSVKIYDVEWNGLIGKEKERFHPTQKPVKLFADILNDYTKKEDTVCDFFGGSGSTMIACEQLGRKCYMMELDPHYCDVIIARWEKLTGKKATKIN